MPVILSPYFKQRLLCANLNISSNGTSILIPIQKVPMDTSAVVGQMLHFYQVTQRTSPVRHSFQEVVCIWKEYAQQIGCGAFHQPSSLHGHLLSW